jgi:vitamin B12 transporter
MILRYFIIISAFLLAVVPAAGQRQLIDDDTLFFALEEQVTVTATRIPTALRDAPAAADIFTSRTIAALPVRALSDVLSLSSGSGVRDYGGSGALQLVSLRGLGAEYTLVLLDGMRLNGAQNALVDAGQLTLQSVDRIEIVRGGLASLYGSNALGGVVNIVTSRERAPLTASFGLGAFGWRQAALSTGDAGSVGRIFAELRYEESANDFHFTPAWGGNPMRRMNAAMYRRSATAGGTLFLRNASLTLYADFLHLDVGVPGAVFSASQGRARQEDLQGLLSLQLDLQLSARSRLRATLAPRAGRQRYDDPDYRINGSALASRYDHLQLFAETMFAHEFRGGHHVLAGLELTRDQLESDDIRSRPDRLQAAAFASGDLLFHVAFIPVRVHPSLRYDLISDSFGKTQAAGPGEAETLHAVNPSIGVHVGIMPEILALRGRLARGFAMPTFNQLYWREGGNPSLKPEYSTAFDAGIVHTAGRGFSTTELTWFHHDITDKIVWAPSSGQYWTPRNVQHVLSTGLEAQWRLQWDRWSLRINAQWISARKANAAFPGDATQGKQLIYVPGWSGALTMLTAPLPWLTVSATGRMLGPRYYNEINTAELPAHVIADAAVHAIIPIAGLGTSWKLELLNAFGAEYEVVAFYPMPGRSIRFTLTTTLR